MTPSSERQPERQPGSQHGSQYFDDEPTVASAPVEVTWSLPDGPLVLTTDRGVFGYGQVDTGTKLLLVTLDAPPATGDLLDLGCGTGAIALTMARRSPDATVWAIDVNRRARDLCTANAARHGLSKGERRRQEAERAKASAHLDGHRRETED